MKGQTRAPAAVIKMSVKSSKGIVGERGQKHLLVGVSSISDFIFQFVHTLHVLLVRTHTKRTFRTKKGQSWS
jgi:hypothetical protein